MLSELPPIYFFLSPVEYEWLASSMKPIVSQDYFSEEEIVDLVFAYHNSHYQSFNPNLSAENPMRDSTFNWLVQTYMRLRNVGFPCKIRGELPSEGIILFAHSKFFNFGIKPNPKQLLVYVKSDRIYEHPYAQFRITQNIYETSRVRNGFHIPHWVHSGLIPRDSLRGDKFETVAFFGKPGNLAPELRDPSWDKKLNELGLQWSHKSSLQWHDYSDVDVVLAVRSFNPESITDVLAKKPASKLYNSWHAGVPAILGYEPAFREQRRSDLDYLEVLSIEDAISSLKRLKDDQQLRQSMVDNGRIRAEETTACRITAIWQEFLIKASYHYEQWCHKKIGERQFYLMQRLIENKVLKPKK